jgi:hypothetical protein
MTRRVLSLWQPWATLTVAHALPPHPPLPAKRVETRHFVPHGQPPLSVAIHATKKWNGAFARMIRTWPFADALRGCGYSIEDPRVLKGERDLSDRKPLPLGAIIGVATILRVTPAEELLTAWSSDSERYAQEIALGNYAPGRFGWHLDNALELAEPIPFSGRQDVLYELDAAIDAAIDAQLTVAA